MIEFLAGACDNSERSLQRPSSSLGNSPAHTEPILLQDGLRYIDLHQTVARAIGYSSDMEYAV